MQNDTLDAIAAAIVTARRTGTPADEALWPGAQLTPDEIYRLQEKIAAELGWTDAPGTPTYWKGGGPSLTSIATFAKLPVPWVQSSPGRLQVKDFHRLAIEIEVAFRLARDISAVDLAARAVHDPAALFDAMAVTIELVDFRWKGEQGTPSVLRQVDLQSNGALVVGDWTPLKPVDWAKQVALLLVDGKQMGRYEGAHVCGDPLWMASQWLQHGVARQDHLTAGSALTTGSWCGMVWLDGPAEVKATFEGIGEASLTLA